MAKKKQSESGKNNGPKIHKTLMEDLKQGGFKRTLKQDFKAIYDFYIDKKTKKRLAAMGKVKRGFNIVYLVLKSMVLKLTPVRRILLFVSVYLSFIGPYQLSSSGSNITLNFRFIGYMILLLILILELKDKLLAQDELAAGRAVQFALMPDENPVLPGWDIWLYTYPANEVGGDLVDYIKIDRDHLCLALGDVAGKGLGAALFTAKLQATFRALAPGFQSLAKLAAAINDIFCRDGLPDRFVSFICLMLTSDDCQVRLMNAGHLPPIIVKKGKGREMEQGATAIGIMDKTDYKEQLVRLSAGDLLVVYSDGLTEARNEEDAFFGDKRFIRKISELHHASAMTIGKSILNEVKDFIGDARPSDDQSLIILKCVA